MKHLIDVTRLHRPLQDAGLVPANCRLLELSVGVNGVLTLKYEVFVTAAQLIALGNVFAVVGLEIADAEERQS
jgi:hypothetical protein